MLNINCFIHIVLVTTDENYGHSQRVLSLTCTLGRRGVREFRIHRIPHNVICCLLFVTAYLYLTNSVAVQLTLHTHAYRMSHNSSVRLCCIV